MCMRAWTCYKNGQAVVQDHVVNVSRSILRCIGIRDVREIAPHATFCQGACFRRIFANLAGMRNKDLSLEYRD